MRVVATDVNSDASAGLLAIGDPIRSAARRAVIGTLVTGTCFSVLVGPLKLATAVYSHAPWLNDPYDTVVSFAMFYVPVLVIFNLVRVLRCNGRRPISADRLRYLLRGCQLILGVAVITVVTEWISVLLKANRLAYNWETWLQVGFLALLTILTAWAVAGLLRAPARALAAKARRSAPGPDWFSDAVALASSHEHWFGSARGPVLGLVNWADRAVVGVMRRHPLWTAAALALAFGVVIGGVQALREGYLALAAVMAISLLGCGMYAFLVAAGGYLGLLAGAAKMSPRGRRIRNAAVITGFGMLVVLAVRNSLWWIVGSDGSKAGLAQGYLLFGIFIVIFFGGSLAIQQLAVAGTKAPPERSQPPAPADDF